MNNDELKDEILVCQDCGQEFLFVVGEQKFYKSKNLLPPKRCRACRELRKSKEV